MLLVSLADSVTGLRLMQRFVYECYGCQGLARKIRHI